MAQTYPGVAFLRLTGNESEETRSLFKKRLGARATPAFFFFRGTQQVGGCKGNRPDRFEDALRAAIATGGGGALPAERQFPPEVVEAPVAVGA